MFCGNEEHQNAAIWREINSRRQAAEAFPHLRKTLESFDGKVFNCRLEKALREDGNYWIVELKRSDYCGDRLEIRFCRRTTNTTSTDWQYMLGVNLGKATDKAPKWDGKRLPAALLIESAAEQRAHLLKEAAAMEEARERVPELTQQIEYMKNQFRALVDSVPYTVARIYNLDYHIVHY